jgi:hypothetical protein
MTQKKKQNGNGQAKARNGKHNDEVSSRGQQARDQQAERKGAQSGQASKRQAGARR